MEQIIYRCEDRIESIFTAIYLCYEQKRNHQSTYITTTDEMFLFAEEILVEVSHEKFVKVARSLRTQFGEEDYRSICYALTSANEKKAQAVYQTIVYGLSHQVGRGHLFDYLADTWINTAFKLARAAKREQMHLLGFLRFTALESNVLFGSITPKNNIVAFMMPHFENRFPEENFMIYDELRDILGVHPKGKEFYLITDTLMIEQILKEVDADRKGACQYEDLFKEFVSSVAIKERENFSLQRSMLPLRFRSHMTEFQER